MSDHYYTRDNSSGFWDITSSVSKDAEAALLNLAFVLHSNGVDVRFSFEADLNADQIAILDGVVAAHRNAGAIVAAREKRCGDINSRTRGLIAEGFDYLGSTFSLSASAQRNLHDIRSNPGADVINTIDDADELVLADAAAATAFCDAAFAHLRSVLSGGTALKAQVRSAANAATIFAVGDDR